MNDESDSNTDLSVAKQRKIGWLTDVGKVRETDEDCVTVSSFGGEFGRVDLLAVADGMGGHAKGEVASKIALNRIWIDSFSKIAVSELFGDTMLMEILEHAIKKANEDILEYTTKNPETSGMGTTSVCAIVINNTVYFANVGDSRAYVVGPNEIRQETKDHSLVQELVDKGNITKAEADNHPNKNVITRAVGLSPSLEVDTKEVNLKDDESLLLCCDGVNAELSDDDIKKIVQETPDPQDACKKIVDMANDRGGSDNISLIILSKPLGLEESDTDKIRQELAAKDHRINDLENELVEIKKDLNTIKQDVQNKIPEEPEFFRDKKTT